MADTQFFTGANLPWVHYGCDFGANGWRPGGGLATGEDRSLVERTLAELAQAGASLVRWFFFCDGRAGLRFDQRATRVELDDRVFADVDAALDLVSGAGLRLMPVLFDFSWCHRTRHVNGVQTGGRRRWLVREEHRAALIEGVVAPVIRRYGQHPSIWAWDVINEPEWITFGLGTWEPFDSVSEAAMRRALADVLTAIHAHSAHPATVGLASSRWLRLVGGLDLDLYQVHWYDHLERRAPLDTDVTALGVDRPIILGEFPTAGSVRRPDAIFTLAARCGYHGALAWSALATDAATNRAQAMQALITFRMRVAGAEQGLS